MPRTQATSFRIPSKYIVFLESLAAERGSDRTAVLLQMLDIFLQGYLREQQGETEKFR